MSRQKETFIKRYIVERSNKAEIRLEVQSEKAESCRAYLWNEIQLKGPLNRNRHKNKIQGSGQIDWFMSETYTATSPLREVEFAGNFTLAFTFNWA